MIAIENAYYENKESSGEYYCDIANIMNVNESTDFLNMHDNIYALKGYLFCPAPDVKPITHLQHVLSHANDLKLPLFIDATLPDPRLLYMASPLRLEPVINRKDSELTGSAYFAAAFPENMNNSSDSESSSISSEDSDYNCLQKTSSLQNEELNIVNIGKMSISDEEFDYKNNDYLPSDIILEAKEVEESSPTRKPTKFSKPVHNIYNDLDNRIKACENNIEDLCIAEKSTYLLSGSTRFQGSELCKK